MSSKAQIIVTIGPSSEDAEILRSMLACQMDAVRFNFSWSDYEERSRQLAVIRKVENELGRKIPIIEDLPGPRVQNGEMHSYDPGANVVLTGQDCKSILFGTEMGIDWIALSFVGSASDVEVCRDEIAKCGGKQKIISKIEREVAVKNIDEIIDASDAIMIARGDLGQEVPVEKIPFIQSVIIKKCKAKGKPVITATEMLISMVDRERPSRAEVTDVATAILMGSDAVMLSDETAVGKYPVEAVAVMERIVSEAERHLGPASKINPL